MSTDCGNTDLGPGSAKDSETKHPDHRDTRPLNVRDDLGHLGPDAIADLYASSIADKVQIICLNLSGDINIGSIIRSASLFGVGRVHLLGRRRYDKRGAVGTHRQVPTAFHTAMVGAHSETLDTKEALACLEVLAKDHVLVVVEQVVGALPLARLWEGLAARGHTMHGEKKHPIFLFGNEGSGIPDDLLTIMSTDVSFDTLFVAIPQVGTSRSHNVSNAAAMVLWEYYRALL